MRKGAFTFYDFGLVFRGGCGAVIKVKKKMGSSLSFFFFFNWFTIERKFLYFYLVYFFVTS